MTLYYPENDPNILEINEIAKQYRSLFEDVYNKNKSY